tara:strand:- start:14 stop:340 length:327 start_codon:yes stop_codon:yes gene_type:complete
MRLSKIVEERQPSWRAKKRERHQAALMLAERIDETCESYLRVLGQAGESVFIAAGLPEMENIFDDTKELLYVAISKMTTEQIAALDSLMQIARELRREEENLRCLNTR